MFGLFGGARVVRSFSMLPLILIAVPVVLGFVTAGYYQIRNDGYREAEFDRVIDAAQKEKRIAEFTQASFLDLREREEATREELAVVRDRSRDFEIALDRERELRLEVENQEDFQDEDGPGYCSLDCLMPDAVWQLFPDQSDD